MIMTVCAHANSDHHKTRGMIMERIGSVGRRINLLKPALWAVSLVALLLTIGCGSDSHDIGGAANYPSGISEDIEQQLKYDSRVDSFDTGSGEDLIVNVNESWLSSPAGMQERSVGQ